LAEAVNATRKIEDTKQRRQPINNVNQHRDLVKSQVW